MNPPEVPGRRRFGIFRAPGLFGNSGGSSGARSTRNAHVAITGIASPSHGGRHSSVAPLHLADHDAERAVVAG
jgi:hypothetical protein